MEEKKNWGGKREGSGRKKKKTESTTISIKLNNDLLKALPAFIKKEDRLVKFNRSEYFNEAVREKLKKDGYLSD